MKGFKRMLVIAEAEHAQHPSQSTKDRVTYLRAIVDLPGEPLTADQFHTLAWIAAGNGRRLHEVTGLRKRDITCIKKRRGALVEHERIHGESWIFVSEALPPARASEGVFVTTRWTASRRAISCSPGKMQRSPMGSCIPVSRATRGRGPSAPGSDLPRICRRGLARLDGRHAARNGDSA